MKKLNLNHWIKISLFSLLVVALLGVLMRYKIAFELPYLAQKNIQHAHSHFAFAGNWSFPRSHRCTGPNSR